MAKIGLKNFRYSPLTEAADGTPSYDGAQNEIRTYYVDEGQNK